MKVILTQDIKGLGGRLDVKEVRDGYARNFLLPKKLAVAADKQALSQKEAAERQIKSDAANYQIMAEKIKTERLEFTVKTGDKDEVFESVNKEKIKRGLESAGYNDFEIILDKPLKALGEHSVEIKFPRGIKAGLTIVLRPQQP